MPDTVYKIAIDTIKVDSLLQAKKIFIYAGKSGWEFCKPAK